MVGELKQSVRDGFKLPSSTAAMTLDLNSLMNASQTVTKRYKSLSRYPSISQDISLKVSAECSFASVAIAAQDVLNGYDAKKYDIRLSPLSIYQSPDDQAHKTISLRLKVTSYENTLKESDISMIMNTIAASAAEAANAERV
jgi:phenylalanyl-tRNA synthetase beta subunit